MLAHTRSLALLLSACVLTSCAVGPDYRPPEIALSSSFLGQDGVELRSAQRQADLTVWWAAFDDPLLTRFVSLALQQNLDIAQAASRVAQSRAALRHADAALLPAANISASAARAYQSVETPARTGAQRHTPALTAAAVCTRPISAPAGRLTCLAVCDAGRRRHAPHMRRPKPARWRQVWLLPRRRPTCTSPSAACRCASRSPASKPTPAASCLPWSGSSTKKGSRQNCR